MSAQMQHMIRMNAAKMQETVADLYSWEEDMRAKDEQLGGAGTGKGATTRQAQAAALRQAKQQQQQQQQQQAPVRGSAAQPAPAPEPARPKGARNDWKSGDMQDYYRKWESFDDSVEGEVVEDGGGGAGKAADGGGGSGVRAEAGPAGIGATQSASHATIPAPRPMRRAGGAEAEDEAARNDPTLSAAGREKDKGNRLYGEARHGEAVAAYTRGLDVLYGDAAQDCPPALGGALQALKATLYCNRAMAHLKLDNWQLAEADASSCLDLDARFVKGYLRRGVAKREQHRYAEAQVRRPAGRHRPRWVGARGFRQGPSLPAATTASVPVVSALFLSRRPPSRPLSRRWTSRKCCRSTPPTRTGSSSSVE
jgi:hypothetical protein